MLKICQEKPIHYYLCPLSAFCLLTASWVARQNLQKNYDYDAFFLSVSSLPHCFSTMSSTSSTPSIQMMNQLKMPFPWKLHHMLEEADRPETGFGNIVSWLPDGKAFKIYDQEAFVETVMRTYFNQSKVKSFTRQLYIYGFLKIPDGPNEGAFYHPEFIRDDKQSCFSLRRNQAGDRRRIKPSAQTRRGSASSHNSASSYDTSDSSATPSSNASPSPTTVTSTNMTQLKAQRRNSLSDYVSGKPTGPISSAGATGPLMMPPPPRIMEQQPRRSSMSSFPRPPSGADLSFASLKPSTTQGISAISAHHQASITRRRNSLSDFFDQALTLLAAEDAYASLPCLDSLTRQQSSDLESFRSTSMIGVFAKQDHFVHPIMTPPNVFSSSYNNNNNNNHRQFSLFTGAGTTATGPPSQLASQHLGQPLPPPPQHLMVAPPPPMCEIQIQGHDHTAAATATATAATAAPDDDDDDDDDDEQINLDEWLFQVTAGDDNDVDDWWGSSADFLEPHTVC